MTASERMARRVVDQCIAAGVHEFVLCAGSRNSPLVLEVLRRELKSWSFFEERSAGFFALGRARALGPGKLSPQVAVVTTSGSAVVELFPALVESHYLEVPLLLITADRPRRFRGSGAPQAIEQPDIFGAYVQQSLDIEDEAFQVHLRKGGSIHLNICLEEPLLSREHDAASSDLQVVEEIGGEPAISYHSEFKLPAKTVVLLGALPTDQRSQVRNFLQQLQAPILAEATSGLREDPSLQSWILRSGERILQRANPECVLRIGGVPSARFWRDLEDRPNIRVVNALHGRFTGLARESESVASLEALHSSGVDTAILKADGAVYEKLNQLFASHPCSEPAWMRKLSETLPPGACVFLGNSLPIREWNLAATYRDQGLQAWANRGANGIDGNLSTFLGLSADCPESAFGIFGDLTTLYDLSAPWILPMLTPGKRFVVVNNGGGRIFSRLPILGEMTPEVKRTTENSHTLHFRAWADLWHLAYYRNQDTEIPQPTASENAVIEIQPDSDQTEAFWRDLPSIYSA